MNVLMPVLNFFGLILEVIYKLQDKVSEWFTGFLFNYVLARFIDGFGFFADKAMKSIWSANQLGDPPTVSSFLENPFCHGALGLLHLLNTWAPVNEAIVCASILAVLQMSTAALRFAMAIWNKLPHITAFGWGVGGGRG